MVVLQEMVYDVKCEVAHLMLVALEDRRRWGDFE